MPLTWVGALRWRLGRHLLDPIGTGSAVDVVRRLGAVPARAPRRWRAGRCRSRGGGRAADQDVRVQGRNVRDDAGGWRDLPGLAGRLLDVGARELAQGLCLGGRRLAGAARGAPRRACRRAAHARRVRRRRHRAPALRPPRSRVRRPVVVVGQAAGLAGRPQLRLAARRQRALQRLGTNSRWAGLPDLETAGRRAVSAYAATFGPAPPGNIMTFLGNGLGAPRRRWPHGSPTSPRSTRRGRAPPDRRRGPRRPSRRHALGRDAPVGRLRPVGPGPRDRRSARRPPAQRAPVSRGAALAVVGGVVAGTWTPGRGDGEPVVSWFDQER